MLEKLFGREDFKVLSVLISLAIGLIAAVAHRFGADSTVELATSAMVGVSLALLIEVWLSVWQFDFRIAQLESRLGSFRGLEKFSKAIETIESLGGRGERWTPKLLDKLVSGFNAELSALSRGQIRYSVDRFMDDFAEPFFSNLSDRDELRAISFLGGGDYWKLNYGSRYRELNRIAARRGVKITRIFVAKDTEHLDELREVMAQQAQFVDVKYVFLQDLAKHHRLDFFVLNSDEIAVEFNFRDVSQTEIMNIAVFLDKSDIRRFTDIMRIVKSQASAFDTR